MIDERPDVTARGEAFKIFDAATGKQIYPTIIDAGLEALARVLERDADFHEVKNVKETLLEVAGWLKGNDA